MISWTSVIDEIMICGKQRNALSFLFSILCIAFQCISAEAQIGNDRLKFVFAFADRSQIAFDPIERKGLMSYSVTSQRFLNANNAFESGDKNFYNGKYASARLGYDNGFKYYVPEIEQKESKVNMKKGIDVAKELGRPDEAQNFTDIIEQIKIKERDYERRQPFRRH